MDALQARVLARLVEGEERAATLSTLDSLTSWIPSWTPWGVVRDLTPLEANKAQVVGPVRMAREQFNDWSTRKRAWALRGTNDEGRGFTVKDWLSIGDAIGSQLSDALESNWETLKESSAEWTGEVVEDVKEVAAAAGDLVLQGVDALTPELSFTTKAILWGLGITVVSTGGWVAWQVFKATPAGMVTQGALALAKASPIGTAASSALESAGKAARDAVAGATTPRAAPAPKARASAAGASPAPRARRRAKPAAAGVTVNVTVPGTSARKPAQKRKAAR